MLGMACGSLALVLVLSVFNGFEGLVVSLYHSINPDREVTVKEGKVFTLENGELKKITALEGVEFLSQTLEENAILRALKSDATTLTEFVNLLRDGRSSGSPAEALRCRHNVAGTI